MYIYQLHLHNHKIRSYGDGLTWMILSHLQKMIPPPKKKTMHEASVQAPSAVQKNERKQKDRATIGFTERFHSVTELTKQLDRWASNFQPQHPPRLLEAQPVSKKWPKLGQFFWLSFLIPAVATKSRPFPTLFRGNSLKLNRDASNFVPPD